MQASMAPSNAFVRGTVFDRKFDPDRLPAALGEGEEEGERLLRFRQGVGVASGGGDHQVTHSFRLESDWVFQHAMSVNGKFLGATLDDFAHVADLFEVPGAAGVVDDVLTAISRWQDFAGEAGLDLFSDKVETVFNDIETMRPR